MAACLALSLTHPPRLHLQSDRKKCVRPDCDGILVFIEGPNKYPILNIEEEVKVGGWWWGGGLVRWWCCVGGGDCNGA